MNRLPTSLQSNPTGSTLITIATWRWLRNSKCLQLICTTIGSDSPWSTQDSGRWLSSSNRQQVSRKKIYGLSSTMTIPSTARWSSAQKAKRSLAKDTMKMKMKSQSMASWLQRKRQTGADTSKRTNLSKKLSFIMLSSRTKLLKASASLKMAKNMSLMAL